MPSTRKMPVTLALGLLLAGGLARGQDAQAVAMGGRGLASDAACTCMASWEYSGSTYAGCDRTPDMSEPWCYVQGGASCGYAKESTVPGETRFWRECGECSCMPQWTYSVDNQSYHGCDVTSDWNVSWCYVSGGTQCGYSKPSLVSGEDRYWRECGECSCMPQWTYSVDNQSYHGCDVTSDWNVSWCYVSGGAQCGYGKQSLVSGEDRYWRECGECSCMVQWNYDLDNKSYHGCDVTSDWNVPWCYVSGGAQCGYSKQSLVSGEDRFWRECGECNCMVQWNYDLDNKSYHGCDVTSDWNVSWCYVSGGAQCGYSKQSLVSGEDRYWRECGECSCMVQWNYDLDNQSYHGCDVTSDWDVPWCYVSGGAQCGYSKQSLVSGEDRFWRECGECNCMVQWNYDVDNKSYHGCSPTPDSSTPWCYVSGGASCDAAGDSQISGEERKWRECDPCACMHVWPYNGSSYKDCDSTPDWETWCYVEGAGDACGSASVSSLANETRRWKECNSTGQDSNGGNGGEQVSKARSAEAGAAALLAAALALAPGTLS